MAHPIHPMLVHFPIACWTLTTIGDVASYFLVTKAWWWMSSVLLTVGVITALVAMVAGLLDLSKIEETSPAMQVANWHMYFVVMAWSLYAISLFMRVQGATFIQPSSPAILVSILGFFLLSIAGWLGGKLVYEHGIGVENKANFDT